jgi:hypothetical protein
MWLPSTGRVQNIMSTSMNFLRLGFLRSWFLRRVTVAMALCAAFVGLVGTPAQARVFVGIGIPFYGPGFYPPPIYYPPPPIYYAPPPPPTYYVPPQAYSAAPGVAQSGMAQSGMTPSGAGQACYAGSYVCPMDRPVATGGSCYCLGNGGQRVWGRAN